MLGFQTYWEPIVISADALIVYLLYKAYRSRVKEADVLVVSIVMAQGASLKVGELFDYLIVLIRLAKYANVDMKPPPCYV